MSSTTIDPVLDAELNALAARHEAEREAPRGALITIAPTEERSYAVLTHLATLAAMLFSGGLLHVFVPAFAWLFFKDKSTFLRDHARQQLNFQLTFVLAALVGALATFLTVGFGAIVVVPALVILFVTDIVCSIKAALAAHRGEDYRFPLTLDLVK
ncbi:MAG: DUF4870 domain-containing protein [Deltaproteobacteria bacterium]|nr:DUF4870 domain-containing protein [Deltaproteobacteria bacterium]